MARPALSGYSAPALETRAVHPDKGKALLQVRHGRHAVPRVDDGTVRQKCRTLTIARGVGTLIYMYFHALGTALPERRYTKADCWEAFAASDWFGRLNSRSRAIASAVLRRDNGIEARWLAVDSLRDVFAIDPDTLHQRFAHHAPRLATAAGHAALQRAHLTPAAIDAVIVTTCTGYLCPALSGYVIERLALRGDVLAFDLVGQGCAGALPNWQLASALIANQCQHVLSICVEVAARPCTLTTTLGY